MEKFEEIKKALLENDENKLLKICHENLLIFGKREAKDFSKKEGRKALFFTLAYYCNLLSELEAEEGWLEDHNNLPIREVIERDEYFQVAEFHGYKDILDSCITELDNIYESRSDFFNEFGKRLIEVSNKTNQSNGKQFEWLYHLSNKIDMKEYLPASIYDTAEHLAVNLLSVVEGLREEANDDRSFDLHCKFSTRKVRIHENTTVNRIVLFLTFQAGSNCNDELGLTLNHGNMIITIR